MGGNAAVGQLGDVACVLRGAGVSVQEPKSCGLARVRPRVWAPAAEAGKRAAPVGMGAAPLLLSPPSLAAS